MDALPSVDEDFPDQQAPPKPLQGVSPYAIGIQKYWEGQHKLPTVDDDFGPTAPPSWATRADAAMQNSIFRIQNAFGTGTKAGFGTAPLETFTNVFSKESVDAAKKAGWWNDYAKGEADVYKTMLEGGMRGAAVALAIGQRTAVGLLSGAAEAIGQTGEELHLAAPGELTGEYGLRGAVTDPGVMMALAPFGGVSGKVELSTAEQAMQRAAALHTDLDTARAHGTLAEDETGYYDLRPPTPESTQARAEAARSAGIPTPTPEPPPKNIEELARRIAPKEFQRADEIVTQRAEHAQELVKLSETSPEVVAEQSKISSLLDKVNGVQEKLPEAEQRELQDAQARLEVVQRKETPEMAAVREKMRALDTEATALAGDISEAHRQAEGLMPDQKTLDELVKAQRAEPAMLAQPEVSSYPVKANLSVVSGAAQEEELARTVGEARVAAGQVMRARQEHPEAAEFQKQIDAQLNPPEAEPAAEPTAAPKTRTTTSLRPVEGTGEVQTRMLAQGVEDKAVASKLTDSFGDLPEYDQVSMADQAARANQLIADDYETAKAVALGTKQPPRNVLPESVFVAVEKRAIADGDVDTLRQLATESKLTTAATTMGQRIRTLRERDPTSPVGAIQEIQRAREAARTDIDTAKQAVVNEIKAAVRRNATPKPVWDEFINSIMCAEE